MEPRVDLAACMAAYQRGDATAARRLYEAVASGLLGYLWRLMQDRALAEDVLQEVFLRVHRVRHTYLAGRPVKPWLYAIARHVAIDALRRRGRRLEVGDPEPFFDDAVGDDPREATAADSRAELERALAGLDRNDREALLLTRVEGLSMREAATTVGTTEGAMKVRVHRAMKRLMARTRGLVRAAGEPHD